MDIHYEFPLFDFYCSGRWIFTIVSPFPVPSSASAVVNSTFRFLLLPPTRALNLRLKLVLVLVFGSFLVLDYLLILVFDYLLILVFGYFLVLVFDDFLILVLVFDDLLILVLDDFLVLVFDDLLVLRGLLLPLCHLLRPGLASLFPLPPPYSHRVALPASACYSPAALSYRSGKRFALSPRIGGSVFWSDI
jgi:hypothetical protein